jgi:hypothetical protein
MATPVAPNNPAAKRVVRWFIGGRVAQPGRKTSPRWGGRRVGEWIAAGISDRARSRRSRSIEPIVISGLLLNLNLQAKNHSKREAGTPILRYR